MNDTGLLFIMHVYFFFMQGSLSVSIVIYDDREPDVSSIEQRNIDEITISSISINVLDEFTTNMSYTGTQGIASVELSYRIQCAEGYSGDDCTGVQTTDNGDCTGMLQECYNNNITKIRELFVSSYSACVQCTIPDTKNAISFMLLVLLTPL